MISRGRVSKKLRTRGASILLWASCTFLAIGILSLGYAGYVVADAQTYQAVETYHLEHASIPAAPHTIEEGEVIGEIQVPRLGLNVIVVQGDSPRDLLSGKRRDNGGTVAGR